MEPQIVLDEHGRAIRLMQDRMSADEFFHFCVSNPEIAMERDSQGNILFMPPTGFESGRRESRIIYRIEDWAERYGGYTTSSNGAFTLPNGAVRSADGVWISAERYEALSERERERFPSVAPDFVAEVVSRSDTLAEAQAKMEEYIANGVRLGFLIDRFRKKAWIYRAGQKPEETSDANAILSGEDVMPGFQLDLREFL